MKEEALKLADEFDEMTDPFQSLAYAHKAQAMIRRLVEELDKQTYKAELLENRLKVIVGSKPLSDDEIDEVAKNNFEGVGRLIYMIVGNVKGDDFRQAVRSFARAIEERHGIK